MLFGEVADDEGCRCIFGYKLVGDGHASTRVLTNSLVALGKLEYCCAFGSQVAAISRQDFVCENTFPGCVGGSYPKILSHNGAIQSTWILLQ